MNRLALPILAGLAAVGLAADPPKPPTPPAGTEVIYLAPDGPIRVRVAPVIDGDPAEARWREAVDALFDFCDRTGDGKLDESERSIFAQKPNDNQVVVVGMAGYQLPRFPQVKFTPGPDGTVGRDGFAAAFRAAGLGPVDVEFRPARADSTQLTDALFKHLDTDGDGKLSAAELKAARDRLAPLDVDEDEVLTTAEMLGQAAGNQQRFFVRAMMAAPAESKTPAPPNLIVLRPGDRAGIKSLVLAADADKDGTLSRAELGLSDEAFATADADGNGQLDSNELADWFRRSPADLDLAAHLGERPTTRPMVFGRPAPALEPNRPLTPGGRARPQSDGSYAIAVPDARVTVQADNQATGQNRANFANASTTMRTVFQTLTLGKGELTRTRVSGTGQLRPALPMFDFVDRNRDAKVTTAEIDAAIEAFDKAINCRSAVVVQDNGRGLFEVLDRNGDGRLSPRELAAAPAVLADMDRDKDGKLSRREVRRSVAVAVELRSIDVIPSGNVGAVFVTDSIIMGGYAPPSSAVDAPEWFKKMDRNGDGDVSSKEFLGPPALFRKLDKDGDGLLSPAEARAAPK